MALVDAVDLIRVVAVPKCGVEAGVAEVAVGAPDALGETSWRHHQCLRQADRISYMRAAQLPIESRRLAHLQLPRSECVRTGLRLQSRRSVLTWKSAQDVQPARTCAQRIPLKSLMVSHTSAMTVSRVVLA